MDPAYLEEAQDDATRLAIADQERAGLDIVTDGEMRRESYSNRFATALEGWTSTTRARRSIAAGIPTRCREWSGRWPVAIRSRSGTSSSCGHTRAAHEDHGSRAVHDVPAGAGRLLRSPGRARHGVRGCGARRDPRPLRGRRRRGAVRRALHAGASRGRARVRPRRRCATRPTASPAPRPCTSASATRRSSTSGRAATRSCPSSPPRECDQVSIETAQSGLGARRARLALLQDDHPRRARPLDRRGRDARHRGRAGSGAPSRTPAPTG